jgi:hypothetical protein
MVKHEGGRLVEVGWRVAVGAAAGGLVLTACTGNTHAAPPKTSVATTTASSSGGEGGGSRSHAPKGPVGYDVSWPQCGEIPSLPDKVQFAIVGVNGRLPNQPNQCLGDELRWAAKATKAAGGKDPVSVYATVANPADVRGKISDWPKSGKTLYGECAPGNVKACANQYGRNLAEQDMKWLARAEEQSVVKVEQAFLDVEPPYSWSRKPELNRVVVRGMVRVFHANNLDVGVYSTRVAWNQLMGPHTELAEVLAGVQDGGEEWVGGARSPEEAREIFRRGGFGGGQVTMVQLPAENIGADIDHSLRRPGE